jgi:NAD(P)-dependent dehydrogenase (short-subunit alcohol dehydrogenase family)
MMVPSAAVVTGADRVLGAAFAAELVARGASKVYATGRAPGAVGVPGALALPLDVTDPDAIAAVAALARDATLVVNSAVIWPVASLVAADLAALDLEMETNFYGQLGMVRAFAPVLAANGGGAILDVLAGDGATAAAAAAMTAAVGAELRPAGIRVAAARVLRPTRGAADARAVAAAALDGLAAGTAEHVVGATGPALATATAGRP